MKRDNKTDLSAATPPLEAKKILFSLATTEGVGYCVNRHKGMKLDFIDVRRAYFQAPCKRNVYIVLPEEDAEQGMCGKLRMSVYGTRDATQNWGETDSKFMISIGFRRGKASPCVFYNSKRNIRAVIHGDDFTMLGESENLDWFREKNTGDFEVEFRGRLGPSPRDCKAIKILNRIVSWDTVRV
jgi:hypothetical protein